MSQSCTDTVPSPTLSLNQLTLRRANQSNPNTPRSTSNTHGLKQAGTHGKAVPKARYFCRSAFPGLSDRLYPWERSFPGQKDVFCSWERS